MRLRYPAAVLVILSIASGFGFVLLLVAGVGAEFESDVERIEPWMRLCSWVWKISSAALVLLLIYRWFIVPSQHGRG